MENALVTTGRNVTKAAEVPYIKHDTATQCQKTDKGIIAATMPQIPNAGLTIGNLGINLVKEPDIIIAIVINQLASSQFLSALNTAARILLLKAQLVFITIGKPGTKLVVGLDITNDIRFQLLTQSLIS